MNVLSRKLNTKILTNSYETPLPYPSFIIMNIPTVPPSDWLTGVIKQAIEKEAEKLIAEAIADVKSQLSKRAPEIVAGIVINIMRRTDMEIVKDKYIFTINTNET